jgi:hypothetical protein
MLSLGVLTVLVSAFTFVRGQSGTTQGTRGRTDPIQRELQRRFESEAIERALAESLHRRPEHERRIVLAQIKEDFLRIQVVNDDLRKFASSTDAPDLKLVAKCAAAITKLAERLKDNLALPMIEKDSRQSGLGISNRNCATAFVALSLE